MVVWAFPVQIGPPLGVGFDLDLDGCLCSWRSATDGAGSPLSVGVGRGVSEWRATWIGSSASNVVPDVDGVLRSHGWRCALWWVILVKLSLPMAAKP